MSKQYRIKLSIMIKILIILLVILSFVLGYFYGEVLGKTNLLYFTIQSNIWIALLDFIFLFFLIRKYKNPYYQIPDKLYIIHQVFTISISLTGIVFCAILMPAFFAIGENIGKLDPSFIGTVFYHSLIPILAMIDFLWLTRDYIFSKRDAYWAIIPPIYYFGFSLIGYLCNWKFADDLNYPYFFLNYESPAGIFGFSSEMPYFMGSFYWMILIILLILCCSRGFIRLVNKYTIMFKNQK